MDIIYKSVHLILYTPLANNQNNSVEITVSSSPSLVENNGGNSSAPRDTPDDTVRVEVAGENQKMATTQFVDDSSIVKLDESHVTHVDNALTILNNPQSTVESILDFLKKPIVLTTGTFKLSDTFTIFNSFSMPHALLTSTDALIWRQKLAGFFGIRMDMRFRLVVNANKFQQGRYIVGWTALAGAAPTVSNLKNINHIYAHNATLVQRTTVPHVEVDLSSDTSAELLVPFVSVHAFYPLNTIITGSDIAPLGNITIYPYSVLKAPTGSTTCGFTLYVSFENVSLFGAASAQAGVSHKEVANKSNGPISGVAKAFAKGFAEFGNIPLIGEYAKGVSWIADRVSNVASIFGFSKPTAGDCIPKMQVTNAPSHSTVDGDSDSVALSYLNKPGVVPVKGISGTDYDEMDFSYIVSKYAWFNTIAWPTTSLYGDLLGSVVISPSALANGVTVTAGATVSYTPVAFIASRFKLWRGSIKLRFKIVKTEYHSGRIQFAFYPGDEVTFTAIDVYVNRLIVDIRDHNEVELVIPYISRSPWLNFTDFTGQLRITVVDPLVAPSSVSPTIDILIEASGGADFEVACPTDSDVAPIVFVPQSFSGDSSNVSKIISTTIGDTEVHGNPNVMTSITIGDKVTSLRALSRRFIPIQRRGAVTTNFTLNKPNLFVATDAVIYRTNNLVAPLDPVTADDISLFSSCYTMMSGGIRIRDNIDFGLANVGAAIQHTSCMGFLTPGNTAIGTMFIDLPNTQLQPKNSHRALHDTSVNNTITFEVPQYTKNFSRCIPDVAMYMSATMNTSNYYTANGSGTEYRLYIHTPVGNTITPVVNHTYHRIYRAGADDFNLSGFISIPPLIPDVSTDYSGNY